MDVLQSWKGHVPSPLQNKNQISFFSELEDSGLNESNNNYVGTKNNSKSYEIENYDHDENSERYNETSSDIDFERIDEQEDD